MKTKLSGQLSFIVLCKHIIRSGLITLNPFNRLQRILIRRLDCEVNGTFPNE